MVHPGNPDLGALKCGLSLAAWSGQQLTYDSASTLNYHRQSGCQPTKNDEVREDQPFSAWWILEASASARLRYWVRIEENERDMNVGL